MTKQKHFDRGHSGSLKKRAGIHWRSPQPKSPDAFVRRSTWHKTSPQTVCARESRTGSRKSIGHWCSIRSASTSQGVVARIHGQGPRVCIDYRPFKPTLSVVLVCFSFHQISHQMRSLLVVQRSCEIFRKASLLEPGNSNPQWGGRTTSTGTTSVLFRSAVLSHQQRHERPRTRYDAIR